MGVFAAWRVKDSNLGRHQPTDLQSAARAVLRSVNVAGPTSGHHVAHLCRDLVIHHVVGVVQLKIVPPDDLTARVVIGVATAAWTVRLDRPRGR
jgi:hypothetical protein